MILYQVMIKFLKYKRKGLALGESERRSDPYYS